MTQQDRDRLVALRPQRVFEKFSHWETRANRGLVAEMQF